MNQNNRHSKCKSSKINDSSKSLFRQDSELLVENWHDCFDTDEEQKSSSITKNDKTSVIDDDLIRFCLNEVHKIESMVSIQNHHIKKIELDLISLSSFNISTDEYSNVDVEECLNIPKTVDVLKSNIILSTQENLIDSDTDFKLYYNNDLVLKIALFKILGDLMTFGLRILLK